MSNSIITFIGYHKENKTYHLGDVVIDVTDKPFVYDGYNFNQIDTTITTTDIIDSNYKNKRILELCPHCGATFKSKNFDFNKNTVYCEYCDSILNCYEREE